MKLNSLGLLFLSLSLMGTISCGKKTKEKEEQKPDYLPERIVIVDRPESHQDLQQAIVNNQINKVKSLFALKAQIDLNTILADGETLMTIAAKHNRLQIVQILLENHAQLSSVNIRHETPLMVAAKYGHENLVRLFVSLESALNHQDRDGNTALHLAILNDFESTALFLINNNAKIDILNHKKQSPLILAKVREMEDVAILIEALLQIAIEVPNHETFKDMLTLGDVITLNKVLSLYPHLLHDFEDLNPYSLAIMLHPHDKALSITNLLLAYGADLNGPKGAKSSALIEAIKKRYTPFVLLLLREEIDVNFIDENHKSALIWAIELNETQIVEKLLEKKAKKKYHYFVEGKKKTINACAVAKNSKNRNSPSESQITHENILKLLGCRLSRFFQTKDRKE